MSQLRSTRKTLITIIKVVVAVGILGYLFQRIQSQSGFDRLINEPKNWTYLLCAQGLVLCAFSFSFTRWFLLVRGLDLQFRLSDAFRLGALGFMFNQISPGSVGGDLLKAVFIAREQPGKRTEAITTVLVDRVIGLYAMLLIASLGLLMAGDTIGSGKFLGTLRTAVWGASACGTLGLAFVMSPFATGAKARKLAESLPIVGGTVTRLIDAAKVYHSRRKYLAGAFVLALLTHCMLMTGFWCISQGLPVDGPTFAQNASIVPVAMVAGALPSTPGGLGVLEGSMETLFTAIGAGEGDGTIVAVAYRAMTYMVAGAGACYYFSSRKKVSALIHDAETLAEETA